MLNRKQIASKTEENPQAYVATRRGIGNLRQILPADVRCDFSEETLRQRFTQEAVVRWLQSHEDEEYPLSKFMRALGFDWADVRGLKEASFDPEVDEFREQLISDAWASEVVSGPTSSLMEDTRTAMKLVDHWFSLASTEHGDCLEEFIYANTVMMYTFGGKENAGGVMADISKINAIIRMTDRTIFFGMMTALMSVMLGSPLLQLVSLVLAGVNMTAVLMAGALLFRARRRMSNLFKPR